MSHVVIVMGSKSDLTVMKEAEKFLSDHDISFETHICSAHRTPEKLHDLAHKIERESDVVIAAAGMAAHLPGVLASLVSQPVIGVPISSSALNGQDALLAIVQMPPGVPVATVAIDGAKNAAILAVQMLSLKDPKAKISFQMYREELKK